MARVCRDAGANLRVQWIDTAGRNAHEDFARARRPAREVVFLEVPARFFDDPTFVACGMWFGHLVCSSYVGDVTLSSYVTILLAVHRGRNWPPPLALLLRGTFESEYSRVELTLLDLAFGSPASTMRARRRSRSSVAACCGGTLNPCTSAGLSRRPARLIIWCGSARRLYKYSSW